MLTEAWAKRIVVVDSLVKRNTYVLPMFMDSERALILPVLRARGLALLSRHDQCFGYFVSTFQPKSRGGQKQYEKYIATAAGMMFMTK